MDPHSAPREQPEVAAASVQLSTNKENVASKQHSSTQQQWPAFDPHAFGAVAMPRARRPLAAALAAVDAFARRRRGHSDGGRGIGAPVVIVFDDDAGGSQAHDAQRTKRVCLRVPSLAEAPRPTAPILEEAWLLDARAKPVFAARHAQPAASCSLLPGPSHQRVLSARC